MSERYKHIPSNEIPDPRSMAALARSHIITEADKPASTDRSPQEVFEARQRVLQADRRLAEKIKAEQRKAKQRR